MFKNHSLRRSSIQLFKPKKRFSDGIYLFIYSFFCCQFFIFVGDGNADLEFENADLVVKYKPKVIEKNGKQYIQTERFQLDFDTTRLHMNFENLFNGDKALGDNMNVFLNENWRDILTELKPAITFAVEEILKGLINRIFMKVPYNEIFLTDE